MKATVIECVIGILGFDEQNNLVEGVLYPKDPKKIAERLGKVDKGAVVEALKQYKKSMSRKSFNRILAVCKLQTM